MFESGSKWVISLFVSFFLCSKASEKKVATIWRTSAKSWSCSKLLPLLAVCLPLKSHETIFFVKSSDCYLKKKLRNKHCKKVQVITSGAKGYCTFQYHTNLYGVLVYMKAHHAKTPRTVQKLLLYFQILLCILIGWPVVDITGSHEKWLWHDVTLGVLNMYSGCPRKQMPSRSRESVTQAGHL